MISVVHLSSKDRNIIREFLNNAGSSLTSFRYFDSRPFEILDVHKATFMLLSEDKPVCYGHLDFEDDRVWLGLAVIDSLQGFGLGKLMMQLLLSEAKLQKISQVWLSVDNENTVAIGLYDKLGFKQISINDRYRLLRIDL